MASPTVSDRDRILIVDRARDILKAKREGKVAVIFGFQNAKPIGDALGLVDVFYRLGIRIVQLTYQRRNFVGNGVGERGDEGLSRFGLLLVPELNRIGIVIDLSHVAQRSALDAVEASGAPVIISHTAAKALVPHFRNVSDDLIRAVASRGGCVGIAALSVFLREDGIERGSHLEDYLDHVEHAIGVAGIDHVGVGFDIGYEMSDEHVRRAQVIYPEFKLPPMRLQHAAEVNRLDKMPNLTVGLLNRGYSETDIKKLLGQNWYRIFAKIWGE